MKAPGVYPPLVGNRRGAWWDLALMVGGPVTTFKRITVFHLSRAAAAFYLSTYLFLNDTRAVR